MPKSKLRAHRDYPVDKNNHGHFKGHVHGVRKGHRLPLANMWGLSEERKAERKAAIESISKNFKKRIDSL